MARLHADEVGAGDPAENSDRDFVLGWSSRPYRGLARLRAADDCYRQSVATLILLAWPGP